MSSERIISLVCSIFLLCVHGMPLDPPNNFDNEILTNDVQQVYVSPTSRRPVTSSVQQTTPTPDVPVEATTEYKYKDLIEPYTIEVPRLHSIRHSAGTLYYPVGPQENQYEKLMQVYKDHFEIPMNRNLPPSNVPPPK